MEFWKPTTAQMIKLLNLSKPEMTENQSASPLQKPWCFLSMRCGFFLWTKAFVLKDVLRSDSWPKPVSTFRKSTQEQKQAELQQRSGAWCPHAALMPSFRLEINLSASSVGFVWGMHRIKPFHILGIYWTLGILCLRLLWSWFWWTLSSESRGGRGHGDYGVHFGFQEQLAKTCVYCLEVTLAHSASCFGFGGKYSPVGFRIRLGM